MSQVNLAFQRWSEGNRPSLGDLFQAALPELTRIAQGLSSSISINANELVNNLFVTLSEFPDASTSYFDREGFISVATELMTRDAKRIRETDKGIVTADQIHSLFPPSTLQYRIDSALDVGAEEVASLDSLNEIMEELPPRYRKMLRLRYGLGYSPEETAERMGISNRNIKEEIRAALASLAYQMITRGYPPRQRVASEEPTSDLFSLDSPGPAILTPSTPQLIKAPKLIVEVSKDLTDIVARDPELLRRLSPRAFEEFVAELFSGFGYHVELTAQTRDGGKDLIAVRSDHGIATKLLVECKRFSPSRKIGIGLVRELYAVKQVEHATKALLVTTSYFSKDARDFERQYLYELELKDFEAITEWVREYMRFMRRISGQKAL